MNSPFTLDTRIKTEALILIVFVAALQLSGCASTVEKDANKNLFQQALVLQKVKTSSPVAKIETLVHRDKVEWVFSAQQVQPNSAQKHELFVWFSQLTNYSDYPILLQLGPDWISSYRRGNVLRKMIPRGILIEQQYDDSLANHKVIFSFKNTGEKLVKATGEL
ncbi:MAG: hypothetical protein V7765_12800 [Oleispira sp.]